LNHLVSSYYGKHFERLCSHLRRNFLIKRERRWFQDLFSLDLRFFHYGDVYLCEARDSIKDSFTYFSTFFLLGELFTHHKMFLLSLFFTRAELSGLYRGEKRRKTSPSARSCRSISKAAALKASSVAGFPFLPPHLPRGVTKSRGASSKREWNQTTHVVIEQRNHQVDVKNRLSLVLLFNSVCSIQKQAAAAR
jgi:hypothetical protein